MNYLLLILQVNLRLVEIIKDYNFIFKYLRLVRNFLYLKVLIIFWV